jgi:Mor family transcriptional regulator
MDSHRFRCFECGKPAHHAHHVVPVCLGGTRTIPLCHACHGKVHGTNLDRRSLQKSGIAAAKADGKTFGRPKGTGQPLKVTPEIRAEVFRMKRESGHKVAAIARLLNLSRNTVYGIVRAGAAAVSDGETRTV